MNPPRLCPICSAPLPEDAPGGLCPPCLMQAALTPGDRIQYFGNYELLEEIALGGMGIVWKARQTSLKRVVALKMIRGGMLASVEDVRRFRLEAEASANLQHPNIVAVHEVGEHEGQYYFSMDFVDGANLADHCEGKPLPAQQAAALIATIAEAVQFAHQRGILHRDLKPQNVMLDSSGVPHLTDFGLAKRMDLDSSLTQDGAVLGSPSYMAPEQAQGRPDRVGPHTDVYALGAILFEMLTGHAPFRGQSPAETMMRVIQDAPESLAKLDPPVPRDLETICLKALEKEPARRYPTARDFAEDVRRFLAQEPILARPASALRKAESWVRRRPWTLAAASAALVIVMACVIFGLIEQTNFLRAQQLHPGTVRAPGHHTAAMRGLGLISAVAFFTLLWTGLLLQKAGRRLRTWEQLFDPKMHWQPLRPVAPRLAIFASAIAGSALAYAVFLLGRVISAYVWDGTVGWSEMLMLYPTFWFGLSVLLTSARSLSGQQGAALPALRPELMAQVETDIRAGEYAGAIKRVRDAVAGTGFAAARELVENVAARLESAAPGTLVAPHARSFNGQGLLMAGTTELLILFILWKTVPPSQPVPFLMEFGAQFLFGFCMMLTLRVKGFGRRLLVMTPVVVVMITNEAWLKPRFPGYDFRGGPHLTGIFFGCVLMVAAWSRPRLTAAASRAV